MLKRAETVLFRQPAAPIKKPVDDDRKMKDVPKPISAKLDEAMIFGTRIFLFRFTVLLDSKIMSQY